MIRVAVIVGKMQSGGKKNLIMEYYRHMDRNKVQFDFICDSDSEAIPDDEIRKLGGRVYRITPYEHIFKNMSDMRKIFKKNKYPVVHAFDSTMNVFPMYIAKISGVPIRISESLSMANKGEAGKTTIKLVLRQFSKWFANYYMSCGEDCGRWQFGDKLFDAGKVDVFKTVINTEWNAFNPEVRKATRKKYGWENKIVIGHIGRFVPQKNSIRLIEIFSAVAKKESRAVLCLIGSGKLKNQMIERAKELEVWDKIKYLGRREDIQQFYNAMDLFLLPSLYEGLPVVGLEAECCGLPTFFSTEITREANACELGYFIELKRSDNYWADKILKAVKKNMPIRRSHINEVAAMGFDSKSEAARLQKYYFDAIEREGR